MRTLVISDLHLGSLLQRDVLRRSAALEPLLEAARASDRLVLLGDTVELLEGRSGQATEVARPILGELGRAVGREGEVVLVPGNHDHALIRDWVRRRLSGGAGIGLDDVVPRSAGTLLSELTGRMAPASVQVRYPGLWLGEHCYATHGHYCDRLLLDAAGLRRSDDEGSFDTPADYERSPGTDAGGIEQPLGEALPDGIADTIDSASGQIRRALLAGIPRLASLPGARNVADLAALAIEQGFHRRAAIPAMAQVARRLGIDSEHLIFGHIHRRGPLPEDPEGLWQPDPDGPQLVNSGSWVYDSALIGFPTRGPRSHRPGSAVILEDGGPPQLVDLLAEVPDEALRGTV